MTGTQETAPATEKRGGMGPVFMLSLISILALLLVFPGFLAGMMSRRGEVCLFEANIDPGWVDVDGRAPRVMMGILYPSLMIMDHSTAIRGFYVWQYKLAGGRETTFMDLIVEVNKK